MCCVFTVFVIVSVISGWKIYQTSQKITPSERLRLLVYGVLVYIAQYVALLYFIF